MGACMCCLLSAKVTFPEHISLTSGTAMQHTHSPSCIPYFLNLYSIGCKRCSCRLQPLLYMNGDKPRSEYYHLRSICCYTTDFELNLQNEKISTNPQYSPSSPGLCAGEKSERTKQICFLLNPEDLHGNKKQRFKGRCVFTTVQSDPDAAHAQKTWGQ